MDAITGRFSSFVNVNKKDTQLFIAFHKCNKYKRNLYSKIDK